MEKQLLQQELERFQKHLTEEEKSEATIEKYIRDVTAFFRYAGNRDPEKNLVIEYKQQLIHVGYCVRSINSMLASLNSYFVFSDYIFRTQLENWAKAGGSALDNIRVLYLCKAHEHER